MKALITGGGGFLGSRIARMLRARGDDVTILGRNPYPHLQGMGIRTIQADLCNATAVRQACLGVQVIYHAGALAALTGPPKRFWDINVGGTRNVLQACRDAAVASLIFTSSPSVVFGENDLCGVNESQPYPKRFLSHYQHTKAVAEQEVLAANSPTFLTVALRPHLIWGPGDPHLLTKVVRRAQTGKLVQVGDGRNLVDITYIDNAASAHIAAANELASGRQCAGKAYFISQGQPVYLWPWLFNILRSLGIQPPNRAVSSRFAYRLGTALEFITRMTGYRREPRMTRFLSSALSKSHYFDISAARRDFNYEPSVTTEEGLERTLPWLRNEFR